MAGEFIWRQLMKIFGYIFLLAFSGQITLSVKADETNELYVTDNSVGIVYSENAAIAHHAALVEEAKKTRESLPAKDFPEGNWGEATNGIQLSLRFTKETYTNGEPIEAILLLRNVTNQMVKLGYLRQVDSLDGPARFQVLSDSGSLIPEHYYNPIANQIMSGGSSRLCPLPGTQQRYVEHLDGEYRLTNGTYSVHAIIGMSYYSPTITEVKSAAVTIKIEDSTQ